MCLSLVPQAALLFACACVADLAYDTRSQVSAGAHTSCSGLLAYTPSRILWKAQDKHNSYECFHAHNDIVTVAIFAPDAARRAVHAAPPRPVSPPPSRVRALLLCFVWVFSLAPDAPRRGKCFAPLLPVSPVPLQADACQLLACVWCAATSVLAVVVNANDSTLFHLLGEVPRCVQHTCVGTQVPLKQQVTCSLELNACDACKGP